MKYATRFRVLRAWKLLIADLGLQPAHVLTLAQLPTDLFGRPDATMTTPEYFALWRAVEEAATPEELPLFVGRALTADAFDPPIFASLCSPNLDAALTRLSLFKRLIAPVILEVEQRPDQTIAVFESYGHECQIPPSLGTMEMVFLTELARRATRHRVVPLEVTLPDLPDDLHAYTEYFGCPLRRGSAIQIRFSSLDARRPFLTEDTGMWEFFEAGLKKRLFEIEAEAGMRERVRSCLVELLPAGQSSIDDVARRLNLSKRTLQRQLTEESTRFLDILNDTRRELATHYLVRSGISAVEIAYLLGFQDGNSFIRAFKGWTGATPGEYRSQYSGQS